MNTTTLLEPLVHLGKLLKKKHRQLRRHIQFGTRSYVKEIILPNTQFKIVINPSQNACVDETIALQGYWEKELSEQLTKYITPGCTFLDLGANIGYHSLFVASLLKNTGAIHSFEPIKRLSEQIKNSAVENNFTNITVHNLALGDRSYKTEINLRDENMGGSSLAEYTNLNLVTISATEKITVVTLDSLLPPTTKVDVIKIDVEGFEFEALKGARKLLQAQHPVIFMEFSPIFYNQDYATKAMEFIEFLKELGYAFETLSGRPINLQEWLESAPNSTQIDVICKQQMVT